MNRILLTVVLATGAAHRAGGQTSPSGLPITGWPAQVALAGGGAAAWVDPTRTLEFPVLAWVGPHAGAYASFGMPGNESSVGIRSFRAGALKRIASAWAITLSTDWRGSTDVIDQPGIPSGGLAITDWSVRAGVGRRFDGIRTSIGVTAQLLRAAVFGTQAAGERFAFSAATQPASSVLLLIAVTDVGTPLRYQSGDSTWRGGKVDPVTVVGAAFRTINSRTVSQRIYADLEKQAGPRGRERLSIGADVVLCQTVTLRGGAAALQEPAHDRTWKSQYAGGMAVRVGDFLIEYGVTSALTTDDLTPRHHLGFGWGIPPLYKRSEP